MIESPCDMEATTKNNLDEIFGASTSAQDFAKRYLDYLSQVVSAIDTDAIGQFIHLLLRCRDQGKAVYFIGNGGSAATASHFANDLAIGTRLSEKPFRVMSLTDNAVILTALGNDDGYEQLFKRQLEVFLQPGDMVVAISASGNSPNILRAIEFAKSKNTTVVGITGFDGGKLKGLSDLNLHVPTPHGEYGPVEDAHCIFNHLVGSYLFRSVRAASKESSKNSPQLPSAPSQAHQRDAVLVLNPEAQT